MNSFVEAVRLCVCVCVCVCLYVCVCVCVYVCKWFQPQLAMHVNCYPLKGGHANGITKGSPRENLGPLDELNASLKFDFH